MTNDWGSNNDEERMVTNFFLTLVTYITVAAVLALMVCMCSGCSVKKVAVGGSSLRVDTVYRMAVRSDSVRVRDSVWVETWLRGDTVFRVKEVTRWRDRMSVRVDTVYRAALRADTVRVPVAVERRLSWWERARDKVEDVACLVALVCLLPVAARWAWRSVRTMRKDKEE